MIVTYPDHTIRNIPDLIKTAKARSEPILGGVPGAGTPQHLLMEYFSRLAGIKIKVVPFRGGNQALTELLGKRIDFLVDPPIALIGQIKSGALHAIGVTGGKRYAPLPDVGTIAEAGFPGFSVTSWMGLVGPAKLPAGDRGAAQQRAQRADRRARGGRAHPHARQRAQGRHARRFQGADRQGHRALDQGDRRRRHRAHLIAVK